MINKFIPKMYSHYHWFTFQNTELKQWKNVFFHFSLLDVNKSTGHTLCIICSKASIYFFDFQFIYYTRI